jgi:hypothetical protein
MATAIVPKPRKRLRNSLVGFCLVMVSILALAFSLYPIYIIRPFTAQQPAPLQRALWVILHYRPILIVVFLVLSFWAVWLWRRAGWVARLLLVTPAIAIALLATVISWVNPYEKLMFHAFGEPRYVSIQQANIDAKDMVIAVTLGGESRAYPIREMGYHHIVNDRLHQLPIVVTY